MDLVRAADAYFDAVPRQGADAIEVGPFTLFRTRGAWNYYARPTVGGRQPVTGADLAELDRVRSELALPLALEWLPDCCPSLEAVARDYGLVVHDYVLMSLEAGAAERGGLSTPAEPGRDTPAASGVSVRLVDPADPEDPAVPAARAVADVAFGPAGSAPGRAGVDERNEMLGLLSPLLVEQVRERIATGAMVLAVAERDPEGVVGSGAYQPVGDVAEIVGVATLPALRCQGVATALSALLARAAFADGITLLVLSAGSESVARVYAASGFQRTGRSLAAEPPSGDDGGAVP